MLKFLMIFILTFQVNRVAVNAGGHENEFLGTIVQTHELCLAYENAEVKAKAREVVPLEKLKTQAKEKAKHLSESGDELSEDVLADLLVVELLAWFKKDFFVWLDKVKCQACDAGDLKSIGTGSPTPTERLEGASVTEM